MKNLIKTILGILLFVVIGASVINAQESSAITNFAVERRLNFYGDSETKEIKIEVKDERSSFDLKILSSVQSGELKVEIFDHEGKKQGSFSVGCQLDKKIIETDKKTKADNFIESVNGNIRKSVQNPVPGIWVIKIYPQNAVGNLRMDFIQEIENK
jgi:nitrogen fixation protein FixH